LQTLAILLFGFLLLVLQSTFAHLIPVDLVVPNAALTIILYMGLHDYNVTRGVLMSFALGYLMDAFAGSPMGLHTFVAVAVFLVSRVAALRLFLQGWIFEIILTFFLTLLASALVLGLRALFDKDFGSLLIHLKIVVSRAVATAVVAPLVFRVMTWIERITARRKIEGKVIRG
jgi:rod shape-determining protein MreD